MGKSEILLLIASVAIGIALMIGMVVPIIKDGKDMVETRNLAQEMSAIKDKFTSNQVMKPYTADASNIKIGGTNFLEANTGSNKAAFPYKAKNTGVVFTKIHYNKLSNVGVFTVNIEGTKVAKIDFEGSELLKSICDSYLNLPDFMSPNIITCQFKGI